MMVYQEMITGWVFLGALFFIGFMSVLFGKHARGDDDNVQR